MNAPEPAAPRTQRAWLATFAAAALLVLAFHYRLALPGRALVANDFRALFIPLRQGLQNTLREGSWPFWQRGMFLGYPITGDIQFQLWNPLTWLTLPLAAARGVTVQSLLELCLCAAGMVAWLRARGLRPPEALFGALAFALCLKQTVHLHHWTFASSTCAWPWMLAGLDGFAASRRSRALVLSAAAACGTWLGSSPQMAWFGCGLAVLYALTLRLPWREKLCALASLPLGVALAAPLLLPVAELSALGPRGPGVTYRFAASWSWPGREIWPALLLPRLWGGRPSYRGPMNYWELQGYVGLVPLALAACAPRRTWLFAAVAALCVWISFGDSAWLGLHRWAVQLLPGYGSFRNPTRAMMLAAFCVALLAAEGLAALRADARLRGRAAFVLVACGVGVGLVVRVLGASRGASADLRADAVVAGVLLTLGLVWIAVAQRRAVWALCAVPLFLADVGFQTWDSPEVGEAAREGRALEQFALLVPAPPQPRRVAALLDWGEGNNATFARGWEGVTGYGPTPILRVLQLLDATWTGAIRPARPLDDDPNFPRFRPSSELVPLLAAPLLVAGHEPRAARLPALPRAFFTPGWTTTGDLRAAARGALVTLDAAPSGLPPAQQGALLPADVALTANTLTACVTAPQPGLVVLLDPWFPGWSATVDGAPAPLLRADFAFMAVPVAAGGHTVALRYFPARLLPGFAVALLAALALVAIVLHLRKLRRFLV